MSKVLREGTKIRFVSITYKNKSAKIIEKCQFQQATNLNVPKQSNTF